MEQERNTDGRTNGEYLSESQTQKLPVIPEEAYAAPEQEPPVPGQMPAPRIPEDEPTVVKAPRRKRLTGWKVVWVMSKYVWRMALGLILAVAVLFMGMVGYLTVTEYNPAYAETADRGSVNRSESITARSFSLLTFNTGYAGLDEDADFFMDGGQGVLSEDPERVEDNVGGILRILEMSGADFLMLQEVDVDSRRSFGTNQWLKYEYELEDYESRFALNYSCDYVPYPLRTPVGKVNSGLATYSSYDIVSATRYSLPTAFEWPERVANLKRCFLVTRIPIEDSEQQLVLINVHMEAYDDTEISREQIKQLTDFMKAEYDKGNFVIAGGDFNQSFPDSDAYPVKDPELWTPGKLTRVSGLRYFCDDSAPTCRLLNQPYDPDSEDTQYYVIDGFLVTANVIVNEVKTLNYDFAYSDHNPVCLEFTLNFED